jgi:phage replication-related protein YjqB (UPF0714/DUF867 family)
VKANSYVGFADLAKHQRRGRDFEILICRLSSRVAVIAPHGGGIERGTSEIARAIAGEDFNVYALEGIKPTGNYKALHLTSRLFRRARMPDALSYWCGDKHDTFVAEADGTSSVPTTCAPTRPVAAVMSPTAAT